MASEREGCPFAAWPSFQSPAAYWKAGVQLFFWCRFRNRTPGPPPFSSMNSMPAVSERQAYCDRSRHRHNSATEWELALGEAAFWPRRHPQLLSFLLLSPSESHAGTPTVLIDELDPGSL
jgi:hypothetical protein